MKDQRNEIGCVVFGISILIGACYVFWPAPEIPFAIFCFLYLVLAAAWLTS